MRRLQWLGLIAVAIGAVGCSSTSGAPTTTTLGYVPTSHLTATEESLSWIEAVNAKDRSASLAHFSPQARDQGDWYDGNVSKWPTFTNVKCEPQSRITSTATIHCTFKSHGDASSAGDTFWTVDLHRSSGGTWLITGYGQP